MEVAKKVMIDRIMKLLEMGDEDRNSNPHERENAMQLAAKLMAEHAIEFTELKLSSNREEVFIQLDVDGMGPRRIDWETMLASRVSRAFDCSTINDPTRGQFKIIFCGTKSDVEISVFFFTYLRRTVGIMSRKNVARESYRSTTEHEAGKRNYCLGMVVTIGERLQTLFAKREDFMNSDSKALMVVKKDGLESFIKQQFPDIRPGRPINMYGDQGAFHKGKSDGHSVNLRRPISGDSTRPLGAITG